MEVYARRRVLAEEIRSELGLPEFGFNIEQRFNALEVTAENLADQPMWRVPFYVIAHQMQEASDHSHIIDHAWWLIADDNVGEPWGFVTEPYAKLEETKQLAALLTGEWGDYGVKIEALPKARSPWYPGNCTPILTVVCPNSDYPGLLWHGVEAARALMTVR
jgi:hypothetical protein